MVSADLLKEKSMKIENEIAFDKVIGNEWIIHQIPINKMSSFLAECKSDRRKFYNLILDNFSSKLAFKILRLIECRKGYEIDEFIHEMISHAFYNLAHDFWSSFTPSLNGNFDTEQNYKDLCRKTLKTMMKFDQCTVMDFQECDWRLGKKWDLDCARIDRVIDSIA